jgi:lipoyl(octanoyl) transferase
MALDQVLLESAAAAGFPPTLRFYRWSPPALSIGRFQSIDDVELVACAREGIEVVRRPTGGKSILHLDDFTYSIVMPASFPLPDNVAEAYRIICLGILRALQILGFAAAMQSHDSEDYRLTGGACFAAATQADLESAGRKLCGSAQVRRGGAVLQHGSMLLEDHSELLFRILRFDSERERLNGLESYRRRCTALNRGDESCSWDEVATSFVRGFREIFGAEIEEGVLTTREEARWEALTHAYASPEWLRNAGSHAYPG